MAQLFVSYSRVDQKPFTREFVTRLRRVYGLNSVWYDDGLTGGQNWWEEILRQIALADVFIYLLSPESVASVYCQAELNEARRLHKKILPVVIRERTVVPADLSVIQLVQMAHGFEADALDNLHAAIRRLEARPASTEPPLSPYPTPCPTPPERPSPAANPSRDPASTMPDNTPINRRGLWLSGLAVVVVLAIIVVLGLQAFGPFGGGTPTGTSVAVVASDTRAGAGMASTDTDMPSEPLPTTEAPPPTERPTNTVLPTDTPTETMIPTQTNTPTATATVGNTPTPNPTETLAYTSPPLDIARTPVVQNGDWTPVFEVFDGVEMALVPAGCFMMGRQNGETDERPVHEVCFEEPFWIDRYEVTNADYAAFLSATGNQNQGGETWLDADDGDAQIHGGDRKWVAESGYENHPAIEITWYGAAAFCEWHERRLPTEAEWEYAARGADELAYPWGNEFVSDNAVWDGNSGGQSAVIGSTPGGVSWVGTLDLSGNVWEWVADWYGAYSAVSQISPLGPNSGISRVARGGSWGDDNVAYLGTTLRLAGSPNNSDIFVGFRCARSQ